MTDSPPTTSTKDIRGFTVIELLIVVTMISVIVGFALLQIFRGQQNMKRANAAQQFAVQLEKARLDSIRRHATAASQMAKVTILNATFYSVTTDSSGDGNLDAPQVISLPVNSDFRFDGTLPRTIYFNWRGMTVDAGGAPITPALVTISSASSYGSSRIDLTSSGQPSLVGPPVITPVTNSPAPTPVFRPDTRIP